MRAMARASRDAKADTGRAASKAAAHVWWLAVVGLATTLLCLPFFWYFFWLGDEGVLLHGADRILRGEELYVDFFEFLPPGGFLITAGWFGIAGISTFSARLLAIATIVGIACLTFLACRKASRNAPVSALIVIGWVIASQGYWTAINHHWFTTLLSMAIAWITLASTENPKRGPLLAGLLVGAAGMVIPTRGAFAALAGTTAFLDLRRQGRALLTYVAGWAVIPIFVLLYLLWQGSLVAAFEDVIVFSATQYAPIQWVPFGLGTNPRNLPLRFLFQGLALLTLFVVARDWRRAARDPVLRISIAFALAGFAGCFPRPDMIHVGFAAPLACPLLAYGITRIAGSWPKKVQFALVAGALILGAPSLVSFYRLADRTLAVDVAATARGKVAFGHASDRALAARIAATPPGEAYLFYPYMPTLPFLTARQHVSRYDILLPGYSPPSHYEEACLSAMRRAAWVIIDRGWTDPEFLRRNYPTLRDPEPREKRGLESALERGFELVAQEGTFEMRRRAASADESLCAGIAQR